MLPTPSQIWRLNNSPTRYFQNGTIMSFTSKPGKSTNTRQLLAIIKYNNTDLKVLGEIIACPEKKLCIGLQVTSVPRKLLPNDKKSLIIYPSKWKPI
ncbi:MAG: hypothetical protein WCP97_00835 [bacterium]